MYASNKQDINDFITFFSKRQHYVLIKKKKEHENFVLLNVYQIKNVLTLCGVKLHKVEAASEWLFSQLLEFLYFPHTENAKATIVPSKEEDGGQSTSGNNFDSGNHSPLKLRCFKILHGLRNFFELTLQDALSDHLSQNVDEALFSRSLEEVPLRLDDMVIQYNISKKEALLDPLEPGETGENKDGLSTVIATECTHDADNAKIKETDNVVEEVKNLLKYVFEVDEHFFAHQMAQLLVKYLSGSFLTTQPLLRWAAAVSVSRGITQSKLKDHNDSNTSSEALSGKVPIVIFIGGTSGSGKSTLASALAQRLNVTHILSTDTIRQILRCEAKQEDQTKKETDGLFPPELFVSTYEAFRARPEYQGEKVVAEKKNPHPCEGGDQSIKMPTTEEVVHAYKVQSECVLRRLEGLIERLVIQRRESIIVEGAHLLPSSTIPLCRRLLLEHKVACVNALVYIKSEDKHKERFSVRAKSMSLQPSTNKYVKSFKYIRVIQDFLLREVRLGNDGVRDKNDMEGPIGKLLLLKNTNVDKTIAQFHLTVLKLLEAICVNKWNFKNVPLSFWADGEDGEHFQTLSGKKALALLLLTHKKRGKDGVLERVSRDRNKKNHNQRARSTMNANRRLNYVFDHLLSDSTTTTPMKQRQTDRATVAAVSGEKKNDKLVRASTVDAMSRGSWGRFSEEKKNKNNAVDESEDKEEDDEDEDDLESLINEPL